MELDKRPNKGHGLLSHLGTAALFLLAITALAGPITVLIMLRQARIASDLEALRAQQWVAPDQDDRPVNALTQLPDAATDSNWPQPVPTD